jgi:hypothetical protein
MLVAQTAAAARALVSPLEYDMSVLDPANAAPSRPAAPAHAYLMPLPEEQSAYELRLADEQWALDVRLRDPAARAQTSAHATLCSRSEFRSAASAVVPGMLWNDKRRGGEALSAAAVARRLAQFLHAAGTPRPVSSLASVAPMASAGPCLTGADGPLGRYTRSATQAVADPQRRFDDFFRDDPFESEGLWAADDVLADIDPSTFAMYRAIAQTTSAHSAAPGYALRGPLGDIPLVPEIPKLDRSALQAFHMPPRLGDRLCAKGERCVFNSHAEYGHVGREFYTRDPPAPGSPLGLCLNCLQIETRIEMERNVKEGVAPALPINTFTVVVGETDYGAHAVLPLEVDGRRTGISGPYPRFDTSLRAWVSVPEKWATHYRIAGGPKNVYFWAETNMDFLQASVASMPVSLSPNPGPSSAAKTGISSSRAPSAPQ